MKSKIEVAEDAELRLVSAEFPVEFINQVNAILREGGWRIARMEMSVCDHHCFAMLIKYSQVGKERGGV